MPVSGKQREDGPTVDYPAVAANVMIQLAVPYKKEHGKFPPGWILRCVAQLLHEKRVLWKDARKEFRELVRLYG